MFFSSPMGKRSPSKILSCHLHKVFVFYASMPTVSFTGRRKKQFCIDLQYHDSFHLDPLWSCEDIAKAKEPAGPHGMVSISC